MGLCVTELFELHGLCVTELFERVHAISAQNAIASKRAAPNPNPSPYGLRKSALTGRCIWVVRAY